MARDDWKGRAGRAAGGASGGASGEGAPAPAPAPAKRGDWRGGRAAAGQQEGAKAATGWAAHKSLAGEKLVWKFRAKVAAWAVAGLVLFGVLIVMLRTPKTTPFISLALTQYKFPLPPNAWAYDDIQNIRDQLAQKGFGISGDEPLTTSDDRRIDWEPDTATWLEKLRVQVRNAANIKWYQRESRGPGSGVVIVYIGGHGVMDTSGNPCLLLPQRTEEDELFDGQKPSEFSRERLLPIETLLETVFPVKGSDQLPDGVVKLVILDANRIDAAWELGILYNDFFDGLKRVVENHDVANLYVLNSCGAGQIGWSAPELGGSAFGFFVKRGLTGFADGCLDERRDQSVSLAELHEFTVREVGKWVANFRGDVQRPELLMTKGGSADRVVIEYAEKMTSRPEPNFAGSEQERRIKEIEQRMAEIRKEGWDRHGNESFSRQAVRRRPLLWQRYTAKLLRLEALAMAGEAYRDQYQVELAELEPLRRKFGETPTEASPPNGLQLAKALGAAVTVDGELEKSLRGKLDGDPKAAETRLSTQNYLARADLAWRWVLEHAKDAKLRERIAAVVTQIVPTGGADWNLASEPVEIHFLRMLHAHLDERGAAGGLWPEVGKAIVRRQAAEQLATPGDLRVQYALRPVANEADELRRLAEDFLFLGGQRLAEANQRGQAADERMKQAEELARTISDALALRDRALDEIPTMVRYYARRTTADSVGSEAGEENEIPQLLAIRDQVLARLDEFEELKPDAAGRYDRQRVSEFAKQIAALRNDFDRRHGVLVSRMKQYRGGSDNLDRRRIFDWLLTPIATGGMRKSLHENWRDLAQQYKFVEDTSTQKQAAEPTGTPASLARALRWMQEWKEHPALRLAEVQPATGATPAFTRDSLRVEGGRLRERLGQLAKDVAALRRPNGDMGLYADGRAPQSRRVIAQADRRVRAVAGLLGASVVGRPEPAESLDLFDRQRLLVWHFERTLADFWGPAPGTAGPSFFEVAANRCVELARKALRPEKEADLAGKLADRRSAAQDGLAARFDKTGNPPRAQLPVNPTSASAAPHQVRIEQRRERDLPAGVATYYLCDSTQPSRKTQIDTDPRSVAFDVQSAGAPRASEYAIQNVGKLLPAGEDMRRLRGTVLYRGHEFRNQDAILELVRADCVREFRSEPPKYPPPTIVVRAQEKPRAIIIVYDCSASMGFNVAGKNVRAGEKTKFEIATPVITELVNDLTRMAPDTLVGLRLYGHQVYYPNTGAQLLVSDFCLDRGRRAKPPRPPEDTFCEVPLTKLKEGGAEQIRRVLLESKLQPYGYTPLYLAIQRAMAEDFAGISGRDYQRQVIVVTDGLNVQRTNDESAAPGVVVAADDLRTFIKRERDRAVSAGVDAINVDILGFAFVPAERKTPGWNVGDRKELDDLVKSTETGFHIIGTTEGPEGLADRAGLMASLAERMGIFRFHVVNTVRGESVRGKTEEAAGVSLFRLNQRITLPDVAGGADGRYKVEFDSLGARGAPVNGFAFEVRGRGEGLSLRLFEEREGVNKFNRYVRLDPRITDVVQYDVMDSQIVGRTQTTDGRALAVIPLRAGRKGTGVLFRVHLRDVNDAAYLPPPWEALAVVEPQIEDRTRRVEPYVVHDVLIDAEQGIPRLSFVAPNWPAGCERAKIRLWMKFNQPTSPAAEFEAGTPRTERFDRLGPPVHYESRVTGDESSSVVKITESHEQPDKTLDKLRVSIQRTPSEIVRCYMRDGRTVIHSFIYRGDRFVPADRLGTSSVQIREVEQMKQGAVGTRADAPIQVRIPAANE